MADEDGSSSSIPHESKTIEPIMAADAFHSILESLSSTDDQTRKTAEDEYERIPYPAKCSLLLTSFLAAQNDEKRISILDRLQSHLDLHWTTIFPNSWTNDRMDQMCSALFNALQCDATNSSVRGKLAQLIAVITRHRMNDNSDAQNWTQLIEYIKMSAYSDYDHHVTSSLAIVQEVPNIFSTDGDACYVFFEGCMKDDHPRDFAILSAAIRALVTAHSSPKCTVETREALNALVDHLTRVIQRAAGRARRTVSNEVSKVFVKLCADSNNVDTKKMSIEVLKSSDDALDPQCLDDVRIILGQCLTCTDSSARSAALEVYPILIKYPEYDQSSLRNLFPSILEMCEDDAIPPEEDEDNQTESHTPHDCLLQLCYFCPSLLVPHLQSIVNLSRETIRNYFHSQSTAAVNKRSRCYSILQHVLAQHWPEIQHIFGDASLVQLCEFLMECSLAHADKQQLAGLMAVFASRTPTIAQMKEFVRIANCATSTDGDYKSMALKIVQISPSILDISEVRPFLERFLAEPDVGIRSSAVRAFTAIVKSVEQARHEQLESLMNAIIQMAQTDTSLDSAIIECLYELYRHAPSLLQSDLPSVIILSCRIILDSQQINTHARRVFYYLCHDWAGMVKKRASQQIPRILEAALFLAFESDRAEWEEDDDGEWADNESISSCEESHGAAHRIRKLITGSGPESKLITGPGRDGLQIVAQRTQGDAEWQKRYVCALAWSQLGILCTDEADVLKSTAGLVTLLADTSPLVQNVACWALKHLAKRRAPILQENCHSTVVPALISLLRQTTVPPRVAAHAGAALATFIKHCPTHSTINLEPAFLEIIAHLQSTYLSLLAENRTVLLDETLAPIRALAKAVPLLIYANYNDVMAPLRGILAEKPPGKFLSIVVRSVSCVGKAAGRSRFLEDGMAVLCYISQHIDALLSTNMADGIDKIFELCGPEMARFLPSLVPVLLAACKTGEIPRDGIPLNYAREHILHTRSNTSQSMLRSLMSIMGGTFDPYMKYVAVTAIEILQNSRNLRRSGDFYWAASILPIAFAAIKKTEPTSIRSLWLCYWSAIKPVMTSRQLVRSTLKIIRAIGPKEVTDEEMAVVLELANRELEQKKRYLEATDSPLNEEEKKISIMSMCECIHYGLISIGDQFVPLVDQVMPFLAPLIEGTDWQKYIKETVIHLSPQPSKTVNASLNDAAINE